MCSLLLAVIYLMFISLGLPDSLLGSGWPTMQAAFGVPFSYPAIQHMAPTNFGKRYSTAVIGLQMASAYVGSTFMPMVFGNLQQHTGIGIMPVYLLVFAILNIGLLERTYVVLKNKH